MAASSFSTVARRRRERTRPDLTRLGANASMPAPAIKRAVNAAFLMNIMVSYWVGCG